MPLLRISPLLAFAAMLGTAAPPDEVSNTLLESVRANDGEHVRSLLAHGANPNAKDHDQVSALMYAALYAGPRVVDLLVKAGADLNYKDSNGLTALFWAAHSYKS